VGQLQRASGAELPALQDVLTEAARNAPTTADPNLRKLGTFYGTCMDSTAIERAGIQPLRPELDRIAAIHESSGVQAAIAHLHDIGIPAGFVFRSTPDAKKSSRTIAEIYQGGLGLPDRDYYLKTDSASQQIRNEYVGHVRTMLGLSGVEKARAEESALAIMRLETALARASMTKEAQRNPESVYHLTTVARLQKSTPAIAWRRYFDDLGVANIQDLNVAQPDFLHALDSLFTAVPLGTWKAYLRWNILANTAPALAAPFVKESFRFNSTVLQGVKEMRPRWKRWLALTDNAVGEIPGTGLCEEKL
jgi:putative endopeptidase